MHKLNRQALSFLKGLLKMDPNERLNATQVLFFNILKF